ncbi:MAG TPA: hypothetical protein VFO60_02965, partial [Candidatus Dormibacteraeota bacterium]|nr:hypothetical protein [Candidatus Dormibacteraeota bacterium]
MFLGRDAWAAPSTQWVGSCCDPEQTIWYLGWVPHAIAHGTNPFVTHLVNAPGGVNLMWNTPTLLIGLVAAPLTVTAGPVVAYNVVITAAIALSAWCAHLAMRRYARGAFAPFVGGALYGFSPYVVPHAALHLDLTFAAVPPLFLLVLDDLLVRRRRPPALLGVALGVLSFVQLLTEEEILATAVIVAGILVAVLALQNRAEIGAAAARLGPALATATVTFVVLAAWPLAVQFLGPQRVHGRLQDVELFSTDLLNLVVPTSYQLVAPAAATAVSGNFSGLTHEANAYLGFPLLAVLVALAARWWEDSRVRTAAIVGGIALTLSLGPHLLIAGASTGWPLPWLPIAHIPLLEDAQPNRVVLFAWLAAAVVVTIAVERARHAPPARRAAFGAVMAVSLAGILPAQLGASTTPVPAFFERWGDE